jgi:hypothetical protein
MAAHSLSPLDCAAAKAHPPCECASLRAGRAIVCWLLLALLGGSAAVAVPQRSPSSLLPELMLEQQEPPPPVTPADDDVQLEAGGPGRTLLLEPTEYDRVLNELNQELLKAYHTKDGHNRTSISPLLSLMAASEDVEDG